VPEYLLPDVGEGLTEAEIVTWKVKVGDQVAINDVVVEIETAKSLVELPSPYAGEVTAILVAAGETIPVGTPIIAIGAAKVSHWSVGRRSTADRSAARDVPSRTQRVSGWHRRASTTSSTRVRPIRRARSSS
jgi:2-oxoisovalerate dehydrogenase E2 component (dihydrolipoyl transacylase)